MDRRGGVYQSAVDTDAYHHVRIKVSVRGETGMGIRRKIALWIDPAGGREVKQYVEESQRLCDEQANRIIALGEKVEYWENSADKWADKATRRGEALSSIIALKTPNCANIGKRMASIAEEALK